MKPLQSMIAIGSIFLFSCNANPATDEAPLADTTYVDAEVHEDAPGVPYDTIQGGSNKYPVDSMSNTAGPDNAMPTPDSVKAKMKDSATRK